MVPGPITPPNPYGDLSSVYPNLSGTNAQVSGDIMSKLRGEISPATMNALKTASAQWGVGSGMGPQSGLAVNGLFGNIAGYSEKLQQEGLQDYGNLIPTISQTQTLNPALQAEIADRNATMAAAPDPAASASYAMQLFDKYLNSMSGSRPKQYASNSPIMYGGPAGGTNSSIARGSALFPDANYDSGGWQGPGATIQVGGGSNSVGGFGSGGIGGFKPGGNMNWARTYDYTDPFGGSINPDIYGQGGQMWSGMGWGDNPYGGGMDPSSFNNLDTAAWDAANWGINPFGED